MLNRIRWSFICVCQLLCFGLSYEDQLPKQKISLHHEPASSEVDHSGLSKEPLISEEKAHSMFNDGIDFKNKIALDKRGRWYIPEFLRFENSDELNSEKIRNMLGKKNNWNHLNGMWGKRDGSDYNDDAAKRNRWNDLSGMWGKRSDWNNLSGMWGKRSDWNNLSGMWGKRSDWNNLSGMWGKRSDWNNLSGMWGKKDSDSFEEDGSTSDNAISSDKLKKNWNELNGLWGKRGDWNKLSGMWGKRYIDASDNGNNNEKKDFKKNWNGLRGMWGKRSDWNNLSGMWGKKSDWNNLSGMWGKRLIDEAQLIDDDAKRTQWNNLNGMWGKRSSESQTHFGNPSLIEDNTSLQNGV